MNCPACGQPLPHTAQPKGPPNALRAQIEQVRVLEARKALTACRAAMGMGDAEYIDVAGKSRAPKVIERRRELAYRLRTWGCLSYPQIAALIRPGHGHSGVIKMVHDHAKAKGAKAA